MRFLPIILLCSGVCLWSQQNPPAGGVTVPLKIFSADDSKKIPPDTVVLQVGETRITFQELDDMIGIYPMNQQIFARGPGKQQFAEAVARTLVLAEEARKRKLDQTQEFKDQAQFSQSHILAQMLGNLLPGEIPGDDVALRKYYDDHRCEFSTWKARAIAVRFKGSPLPIKPGENDLSEDEALAKARDIRAQVATGADFAALAHEQSDDATTSVAGGEIGQVRHGQIMPSFEEALCRLKPGELSEPVRLPTGYHVIQLQSVETQSFAELKPRLQERYRADAAKKFVDDLVSKTTVVKNPEYYAPPAPPAEPQKKP